VTDGSVDAAALNTLDGKTTVNVDATAVTTLTSSATEIKTALASGGITKVADNSLAVTASGNTSVADINTINANAATGIVTATATDTIAILQTLTTESTDNITITATDGGSVAASVLNVLSSHTVGHITDTNTFEITGNLSDVSSVAANIAAAGNDKFTLGTMQNDTSNINTVINIADGLNATDNLNKLITIHDKTFGHVTDTVIDPTVGLKGSLSDLHTVLDNIATVGASKFTLGTISNGKTDVDIAINDISIQATDIITFSGETSGKINIAANSTIVGSSTDVTTATGETGFDINLTNHVKFNADITGVNFTNGTPVLGLVEWLAANNNGGTTTIDGTGGSDVLNFSSVSVGLTINGGNGGDTITGGSGTNTLTGGAGNDQFVFSDGVGVNAINDFAVGDLIDLKNSSFNFGYSGTLLLSSDFNSSAGHSASGGDGAKIHYDTSNHTVYYENGSTTTAIVTMNSAYTLTANDFKVI
jgi:hypothetical protein